MQLQVFGSYEADTLEKVVSATCGKRVTAVILGSNSNMDDLTMAYRRAVAADPYNAMILRQYDIYKGVDQQIQIDTKDALSVGCLLCIGETLCPLCQLKNDFRDILEGRNSTLFLDHISTTLLNANDSIQAKR